MSAKASSSEVLAVDEPEHVRRQSVQLGPRSWVAAAVVVVMCLLLAFNAAPPAMVVLGAAVVLGLTRVVTVAQAQQSISLVTLLVVAGMVPMSVAIQTSGTAELVSDGLGLPCLVWFGLVAVFLVPVIWPF